MNSLLIIFIRMAAKAKKNFLKKYTYTIVTKPIQWSVWALLFILGEYCILTK